MALVKAKDIPYETEALRKRIEFVKKLQKVLEDESMLVTKTVEAYSEVIDGELVVQEREVFFVCCYLLSLEKCGVRGPG